MKNKLDTKYLSLLLCVISALCIMAVVKAQNSTEMTADTKTSDEKCSKEIEGLKLCADAPSIIQNVGEPIVIKFSWINSSKTERLIPRGYMYEVTVVGGEKGEKLIPVFRRAREKDLTTEDIRKVIFGRGRVSAKSFVIEPNDIYTAGIKLSEYYDYDLSAKGTYYVSIKKSVPSIDGDKNIEFVLDDIEIQVK